MTETSNHGGVHKSFAKLTGKYHYSSLFFNKVAKRDFGTVVLLWIFQDFLQNPFYRTPPDSNDYFSGFIE